jgi:vitamin B12 transporter
MTRTIISTIAWGAVLGASPAFAQSNPTKPTTNQQGQTIIVTASRSGDAVPTDLLGASATVLDDGALQDRQTRIASDALRDVPGVAVSRTGAVGGFTQLRLRGAEANQTLVLIDGIKASDPFYGEFDFGTLLADDGAKIEVLRGQQSSLYGSDAIGGVVNYITLTGAEAPGIRLRAEGGSFDTVAGSARAAGVMGDLDYALSGSYYHTRGYPIAVGGSRDVGANIGNGSLKTTWTAASNFRITAVGRYSSSKGETDDQDNQFGSPTFGLTVDSLGVRYCGRAFYGLVRAQLDLLDGRWTNAVSAQVTDTHRTNYDVPDSFSPPAGQPIVAANGDRGRRLKGSFESAFRLGSDRIKQRVTLAVDGERESERSTVSMSGGFLGWRHTNNVGVVGEYEATIDDRLGFGASFRHDENSRFANSNTYRVQTSYKLQTGTRIHVAAGSGVKAPSFSQLFDFFAGIYIGNPALKPEKSEGWEAGLEQSLVGETILLGATYFDNHRTDEITTVYTADGATSVNLPGRTHQRGLEVYAEAKVGQDWRFDANYTHSQAPQTRNVLPLTSDFSGTDTTGQAVRRARDIASANLTWVPEGQPFKATVTVRYNGQQDDLAFTDPSYVPALVKLKAFTILNLNASWRIRPQVELFGRVENALGQRYQEIFSYAAQPRAAYAGVRVRI